MNKIYKLREKINCISQTCGKERFIFFFVMIVQVFLKISFIFNRYVKTISRAVNNNIRCIIDITKPLSSRGYFSMCGTKFPIFKSV